MIYTFLINGSPKALKADSMDEAIARMSNKWFYSFLRGKVIYVCSNDPKAPKLEGTVRPTGLYVPTVYRSFESDEIEYFKKHNKQS